MSHKSAVAFSDRTAWLATAAFAIASLLPVTGVAAEWDIAIEGGYAPARELLSAQHARLDASASGVFVAGLFDEYTRMPAVVRYAPSTTAPAWTSMLGHTQRLRRNVAAASQPGRGRVVVGRWGATVTT